ncbi:MAG: hypothetical protein HFJ26_08470 [Clostridia bacterium]|nr:hypothetical protein [Clostridia bacterium]
MTDEEIDKCKDLIEEWKKEASQIKDVNKQPKKGGMLDNGNSGEYTELTRKYEKLIEERLGRKLWKK